MPTVRPVLRLVPAVALLVACGGADLVLPGDGEPAAIQVVQGNAQTGRVGVPLATPIVVRVTDSQSRPVVGARVTFAFTGDPGGGSAAPDTATSDVDGRATFQVVLGTRVGRATAEVRVATTGGMLTAPLGFDAVSADANRLTAVAGDSQVAPAGAALREPLVVQVTDAFGNPIPRVTIAWAVDAGSVSSDTTSTGDDGLASVRRTLGPAASVQHATATAPGLVGSPLIFTQTASAGDANVLERVGGDGQSAVVGTSVPDPLVVRAKDAAGNPVAGLAVAWVVGTGDGSLTPVTSTTDGDGLASTRWTLGGTAGLNTATAVISGVGTVGFSATAQPGTPPALSFETAPPSTAVRGVGLSRRPVIQLREPGGGVRRRSRVAVSVSLAAGGGTLRGTLIRSTGSDGRVEFRDLVLEGSPGAYALAFTAAGYAGLTSDPIALARAGTTTTVLSDDPDPSVTATPVRVRFRVQSPGGTPTGTVRVSADGGTACSASVAAGECTLSPITVGTRTLTVTYPGTTEFEGSAASEGHVVRAPAPPPPPPPDEQTTTRITSDDPDPSTPGVPVTVRFSVTSDAGTPTGDVTVSSSGGGTCTASVAAGACDLTPATGGSQTLTATYPGGGGFAGSSDTESHSVATPALALRKQPSGTATSGARLKEQPELELRTGDGKPLNRAGVTVTATLASGTGSLTGAAVATTDDKGHAKFHDLGISGGPGTYTIRFEADGFAPVVSDPVDIR